MKMTKRVVNVAVFTAVAIMFLLAFGSCFRMFQEINAMDLSGAEESDREDGGTERRDCDRQLHD